MLIVLKSEGSLEDEHFRRGRTIANLKMGGNLNEESVLLNIVIME